MTSLTISQGSRVNGIPCTVVCTRSLIVLMDRSTLPTWVLVVEVSRVMEVQLHGLIASIRDREYLSLLHRIEFFSSIFKFLAEFREKFKQL